MARGTTPLSLLVLAYLAIGGFIPCLAWAQNDPPGSQGFLALSDGGTSCGEYLTSGRGDQVHMEEWILGFISGLNAGSAGPRRSIGDGYDVNAIPGWLRSYCSAHALDTLTKAALALRKDFADHGMIGR
jgi:hypothetical protein